MCELFDTSADDVSACEEALPPASFASIDKPPVLFGGSLDDELSPLRPVGGTSKPPRAFPDQFAREEEASAVRDLLYEPQLASFRELAQRHHVDRHWLLDVSMVSASRLLHAAEARFKALMRRLHAAQRDGLLQCILFNGYIMSDETPWHVRVSSVVNHADTTDSSIANIMATPRAFPAW